MTAPGRRLRVRPGESGLRRSPRPAAPESYRASLHARDDTTACPWDSSSRINPHPPHRPSAPMSQAVELAQSLIYRPSVSPEDAGCQELIAAQLTPCGFRIEWLPFGDVRNLWARRGNEGPVLCFAGHTDVVPPGPAED